MEEFADTRLADVFIWRIFYQAVILPFVFGKERDKAKIAKTVAEDLPQVLSLPGKDGTGRRLPGR